jgi:hypothetical protein
VDLVDEEDVPLVEVGEEGGHVTGAGDGRPGRDAQGDAHLGGDDGGQRRLAHTGRPGQEHVIRRLPPQPGRLEHDGEVLLELGLADELAQCLGP